MPWWRSIVLNSRRKISSAESLLKILNIVTPCKWLPVPRSDQRFRVAARFNGVSTIQTGVVASIARRRSPKSRSSTTVTEEGASFMVRRYRAMSALSSRGRKSALRAWGSGGGFPRDWRPWDKEKRPSGKRSRRGRAGCHAAQLQPFRPPHVRPSCNSRLHLPPEEQVRILRLRRAYFVQLLARTLGNFEVEYGKIVFELLEL